MPSIGLQYFRASCVSYKGNMKRDGIDRRVSPLEYAVAALIASINAIDL